MFSRPDDARLSCPAAPCFALACCLALAFPTKPVNVMPGYWAQSVLFTILPFLDMPCICPFPKLLDVIDGYLILKVRLNICFHLFISTSKLWAFRLLSRNRRALPLPFGLEVPCTHSSCSLEPPRCTVQATEESSFQI